MHRQWESRAPARWPWLRPAGSGADLVAALFGQAWPRLAGRSDLPADLALPLVSSVEPARWGKVITANGTAPGLPQVLPSSVVQGLLSLSDVPAGSAQADGWITRLRAAGALLAGSERGPRHRTPGR